MQPQQNRVSRPCQIESLETRQHMTATVSNNTFETATKVPDIYLEKNYFKSDRLSAQGPNGFYWFATHGKSQLNATLYGLSADADLFVYNGDHVVVAQSTQGGNKSETINVNLEANRTYYVRVKRYGGDTNFTLSLQNDYSGNDPGTARDLGASWGQGAQKFWNLGKNTYNDYLNYRDNFDLVKFRMEADGSVILRRTPSQNSTLVATMQLFDETGKPIPFVTFGTNDGALTSESIDLKAGTYYVAFKQISGEGEFQFRIVSDYAGGTLATARDLGNVTNTARRLFDMVGNSGGATYEDRLDLYKFTLNKNAPLYLSAETQLQGTDVQFSVGQDRNGDGVISSNEIVATAGGTAGHRTLSTNLSAGTYYVVATPTGANTSYTFDVDSDFDNVPADPQAFNNLGKAIDAGNLNGEKNYTGGFGALLGDAADFYKFKMTANGQFGARAITNSYWSRGTSAPELYIVRDANNNGRLDEGEVIKTGAGGKIAANLSAGTYYLRAFTTDDVSQYDLRLLTNYAGGTLKTARDIGPITGKTPPTKVFSDYIEQDFGAGNNVDDYYKFTVGSKYQATFSTKGAIGQDLALSLIRDANNNGVLDAGDTLVTANVANSPNETITRQLNAGTYFVRVQGLNGWTNYDLSAKFVGA